MTDTYRCMSLPTIAYNGLPAGASSSVMLVFILPSSIFLRTVPDLGASRRTTAAAKLLFVLGIGVAATAFTALAIPKHDS